MKGNRFLRLAARSAALLQLKCTPPEPWDFANVEELDRAMCAVNRNAIVFLKQNDGSLLYRYPQKLTVSVDNKRFAVSLFSPHIWDGRAAYLCLTCYNDDTSVEYPDFITFDNDNLPDMRAHRTELVNPIIDLIMHLLDSFCRLEAVASEHHVLLALVAEEIIARSERATMPQTAWAKKQVIAARDYLERVGSASAAA